MFSDCLTFNITSGRDADRWSPNASAIRKR